MSDDLDDRAAHDTRSRSAALNAYWERVRQPALRPVELWSAPPGSGPERGPAKINRDPMLAAPNDVILRANLPKDVETQVKRYAEYFGVPPTHFGLINGEIMRWVPERSAYAPVVPTMRGARGIGEKLWAASSQFSANTPDIAQMGTQFATGALLSEASPLVSVPASAAVGGFTDWARQVLDKALAGEPVVPEFLGGQSKYDYGSIGEATLEGALHGVADVGIDKIVSRTASAMADRAMAADPVMQAQWVALWQEAQRRGVTLTTQRESKLRGLLDTERALGLRPGTSDLILDARTGRWLGAAPSPAP